MNFNQLSAGAIYKYITDNSKEPLVGIGTKHIDTLLNSASIFDIPDEVVLEKLNAIFTSAGVKMPEDLSQFLKIRRSSKEIPEVGKKYNIQMSGQAQLAECVYKSEFEGEPCFCFKAENGRLSAMLFRSLVYAKTEDKKD